ncbi:FO synthase subunit 1 [Hyella patelloides LEGE 07179]|uniref:7,8-didemethyl-8-hydroxy-5-deazariboflavin synthase n=1 Tax=Hyella patelloides LEGE 07179 TaxID=945734 RepID=A0A563VXC7_9CYAN|nr:7,8-didemethyl-8-hydroxy-5-deazariboflavin synthase subunit CofG [Hyella patelloides]VEP16076.1 FO synthase subunit 1 [Hyella patelloides LEGE 07179]
MSHKITYSPAYTIVPTYECFNRCSYCNFRVDIGKDSWLTMTEAKSVFKKLLPKEVIEILVLSGEVHPNSARREDWFQRIENICELALSMGFLPHTNVGPLSLLEMERLKGVNVSMGLMLEQLTPTLLKTVHKYAPSKRPETRLQQLEWAGKLQIPFTTGLLLGIGETKTDRITSLSAIAKIQKQWGHIQEVILQPHSLGSQQSYQNENFPLEDLPALIADSRSILPENITIQIPPNLIGTPELLWACIEAGARDLGGISPRDEVNPDYPHLTAKYLKTILKPMGWELIPRLPVYPQYYDWLSPKLQKSLKAKENDLKNAETMVETSKVKEE